MRKCQLNAEAVMKRFDGAEAENKNEAEENQESRAMKDEDEPCTKPLVRSANSLSDEKVVKLLGVSWNCKFDELFFNVSNLIDFVFN